MALCTHCGRRVPDNSSTCAGCGSPVSESAEVSEYGRVEDLAQSGQQIEAVKAFREQTGASLGEAKEAVEEWLRTGTWPERGSGNLAQLAPDVQRLAREGHKIEAIKAHREQTGASLAEAKQAVEGWMKAQGLATAGGRGCATSVLSILVGAVVLLSVEIGVIVLTR